MTNNYTATALDFSYHSENSVMYAIAGALRSMVSNQALLEGGKPWQVARANQPTIQAVQNNTIYFDVISKRRLGVQAQKSVQINGKWQRGTKWYEEWLIQVSAFRQRRPEDNSSTLTSADVITKIQACINGGGAAPSWSDYRDGLVPAWFPYDWINVIRSTDLREIDFETDSGLKEKMPQFDFTLAIEQGLLGSLPSVDDVELRVQAV